MILYVSICAYSDQYTRDGTLFQKMVKNDTINSFCNSATKMFVERCA